MSAPRRPVTGLSRRFVLTGLALPPLLSAARVRAEDAPRRIVSLGGAVTEIIYALGAGDEIAALDTTSLYPPEAMRTKPNVGYLRQLSAEGILSARPTLVLGLEGAGPPDVLKLVAEAGVPVRLLNEAPTEPGVIERIGAVAAAIGRDEGGRALADDARRRFAELAKLRTGLGAPRRALFILSLQNGRTMVGGRTSTADGMLKLAGIDNAAAAIEGYKPMTDEAIIAAAPDVIVMMAVGPGGAPPTDLFDLPALSRTPAARDRALIVMDGLYLLGFGPRTPDAARDLALAVYPGLRRPG